MPVLPIEDTVKLVRGDKILDTLNRGELFRVQTPQGFLYSILKTAFDKALEENFVGTDEASLVENLGHEVIVVPGELKNLKITTSVDLRVAEGLLEY